jgi:hypothetical protein
MSMKIVIVDGRQFCTGGKGIRFGMALTACHVQIFFYSARNCSTTHFHYFHTDAVHIKIRKPETVANPRVYMTQRRTLGPC